MEAADLLIGLIALIKWQGDHLQRARTKPRCHPCSMLSGQVQSGCASLSRWRTYDSAIHVGTGANNLSDLQ
jgi:hypothetical protein